MAVATPRRAQRPTYVRVVETLLVIVSTLLVVILCGFVGYLFALAYAPM